VLCFVFSILVVLLDQLFKRWIAITLVVNEQQSLIPGVVTLTHVENSGAAFSFLSGQRWLLAAIMFVCVIVLIAILLRYNEGFWGTLGLAAVLGGAVGNLIDRVFHGYVVDMFEFQFMKFAIFNVADIFITLGGITFCVFFIASSMKSSKNKGAAPLRAQPASGVALDESLDAAPAEDFGIDRGADSDANLGVEAEQVGYVDSIVTAAVRDRLSETVGSVGWKRVQDASNPPAPALDVSFDESHLLGELGLLKSDFAVNGATAEYDVDKLLRDYGFEDDGGDDNID
jgi:signal peptidase II